MALKRVKPGDLITVQLINQVIDEVNRIRKAVADLERKCRGARRTRVARETQRKA